MCLCVSSWQNGDTCCSGILHRGSFEYFARCLYVSLPVGTFCHCDSLTTCQHAVMKLHYSVAEADFEDGFDRIKGVGGLGVTEGATGTPTLCPWPTFVLKLSETDSMWVA